jgi:alpha-amylase
MSTICFYFQVHQPYRVKKYRVFDIGHDHDYFDNHPQENTDNALILHKVMNKCYLPANQLLLDLLKKHADFRISFSLSGVFLKQIMDYAPEVVESFQKLVNTGQVEILAETYYHSLSAVYSEMEFKTQVQLHQDLVHKLFAVTPKVFRNTELIYSNDIAKMAEDMGYQGIITEGADQILGNRSPNQLYTPKGCDQIVALLKNYRLSDDIAFRFSDKNWQEHPLTADKYTHWLNQLNLASDDQVINLFMDYETFGEHQWEESGIFDFLKHLPEKFLANPHNSFATPIEVIKKYGRQAQTVNRMEGYLPAPKVTTQIQVIVDKTAKNKPIQIQLSPGPVLQSRKKVFYTRPNMQQSGRTHLDELDVPEYISWADAERDLSAWRSNSMQHEALDKIYSLETQVKQTENENLLEDWRRLTTSDHFYYMCTKFWSDGDVHKYFSPYQSPYEAFIYYMNVIKDLEIRLAQLQKVKVN